MPYVPASAMTASAVTDSAGGVVSRTIDAAGAIFDQAGENKERSSMADAYASLRSIVRGAVGLRGGGYRPVTPPSSIGAVPASTGATISAAGAVYSQANENEYRGNISDLIDALIADLNTAKALTGPRAAFTALTDNSGGVVGSVASAGATHNQAGENEVRATLAAKLNALKTSLGV